MTTKEFLPVSQKLIETGLFEIHEKGERGKYMLGRYKIGRTNDLNTQLWRKHGTLSNIVIFKKAEDVNNVLKEFGISEFYAKPTKSGSMCRLELKK